MYLVIQSENIIYFSSSIKKSYFLILILQNLFFIKYIIDIIK